MKLLFAFGVTLLVSAGGIAQVRVSAAAVAAQPVAATSVRGAMAVGPQAAHPLGTFIAGASSRPLGGFAAPASSGRRGGHHVTTGYVGPVYYVPNAFDTQYDANAYGSNTPGDAPATPPQHVVVNQYFISRPANPGSPPPPPQATEAGQPASPGDPIGPVENYYLIAYKNHMIYPALAYWVEGDTLHYVTMQNTHNQASIALLDLDQTTRLNADRAVPFALPGR